MFNGKDFCFQQHVYHLYSCFNQEITLCIQVHRCILPSKDKLSLLWPFYYYLLIQSYFHKFILQGTTVFGRKCISVKCYNFKISIDMHRRDACTFSTTNFNFYQAFVNFYVYVMIGLVLQLFSSIHTIMQSFLQRLGWRRNTCIHKLVFIMAGGYCSNANIMHL